MAMKNGFPEWLQDELNKRDWSQADLARRSGVTPAQISRLISGLQSPGIEACVGIARAFGVPVDAVVRAAMPGQMPRQTEEEEFEEDLLYTVRSLSNDDRVKVVEFVKFLAFQERQEDRAPSGETVEGKA